MTVRHRPDASIGDESYCTDVEPVRGKPVLVLDTNVVLDWLVFNDRHVAPIALAIETGAAALITDEACLAELADVLNRDALRIEPALRSLALAKYQAHAALKAAAPALPELPQCRDASDQKFVVLAVHNQASLLVTRDRELLRMAHRLLAICAVQICDPTTAQGLLQDRLARASRA